MQVWIDLFLCFFKIGAFAFGGGYAAIPLIQTDVVEKFAWMTTYEFADIMAIASMTPGPVSINTATYVGYKMAGIFGGVFATFAVVLAPYVLVGIVTKMVAHFADNKFVISIFEVLRPVIISMITYAAINTAQSAFVDFREILLFVVAFLALMKTKIHPIAVIVGAGILGAVIY